MEHKTYDLEYIARYAKNAMRFLPLRGDHRLSENLPRSARTGKVHRLPHLVTEQPHAYLLQIFWRHLDKKKY